MPPTPIERFLLDIDAKWPASEFTIPFWVIGSTALMLQTAYLRGTKDSDVLGVAPITGQVADSLLLLAGKGTPLHRQHQVYLDVVISKLKRFHDNDKADIKAMIELDLVGHSHLVDRFLAAADVFSMDARAHHLTRYAKNLNWVEREYLGVPETEYQLPPWADA